jgi:vacuolar-type H+-ATPase subunit H
MDDTLKKLLETEQRAEEITRLANIERERLIEEALQEARREQRRFEARVPELHASFVEKAEARAQQTVSELHKRYDERHARMRQQAEERENDALEAAFQLITDSRI